MEARLHPKERTDLIRGIEPRRGIELRRRIETSRRIIAAPDGSCRTVVKKPGPRRMIPLSGPVRRIVLKAKILSWKLFVRDGP